MKIQCFTRREFDVLCALVFLLILMVLTFGGLSLILVLFGVKQGYADLSGIALCGFAYLAMKHRPALVEYSIPATSLAILNRLGCEVAFLEN